MSHVEAMTHATLDIIRITPAPRIPQLQIASGFTGLRHNEKPFSNQPVDRAS
jgi:hypothetical protein